MKRVISRLTMINSGSLSKSITSASHQNIEDEPLITFGALADIQYANCENRPAAYDPSKVRFYRGSLKHVDQAFEYWKNYPQKVKFVLQLGDIIDGINQKLGESQTALNITLATFEKHVKIPSFHTVGNHELYNFDRNQLNEYFHNFQTKYSPFPIEKPTLDLITSNPVLYYKFNPNSNIKCISLDCFDISVLGYDKTHTSYQEAAEVLRSRHGHSDFAGWDSNGSLTGPDIRFQQMNGAIGKMQMRWLINELEESDKLHQKVIVFGHLCLHPDSANWDCLLWNYDEVIQVFHQYKCVAAYFSGHSHASGHAVDSQGIGYFVLGSVLETPSNCSSFATVSLYHDQISVYDHGKEHHYCLPLMGTKK